MSSREQQGENKPSLAPEQHRPYQRAARLAAEPAARQAYLATERLIAASNADISAFRLQLNGVWHVAAVVHLAPDRAP